ncbi:unannotated protein [freshwater metagenome]|uniref:Unannotated protein n=1 Tax=freshwater metagenome TaxID=449393 RepID=A0A6J7P7D1_9ZZZZ
MRTSGHVGSRSRRCSSRHRRQGVDPGTTSGPTRARGPSLITTRWGRPLAASCSASSGATTRGGQTTMRAATLPSAGRPVLSVRAAREAAALAAVRAGCPRAEAGGPSGAIERGRTRGASPAIGVMRSRPTPAAVSSVATPTPTRPVPRTCTRASRRRRSTSCASPGRVAAMTAVSGESRAASAPDRSSARSVAASTMAPVATSAWSAEMSHPRSPPVASKSSSVRVRLRVPSSARRARYSRWVTRGRIRARRWSMPT